VLSYRRTAGTGPPDGKWEINVLQPDLPVYPVPVVIARKADRPTEEQYGDFQAAYDFFNKALFQGRLPQCLITLVRSRRFRGYFMTEGFVSADGQGRKTDEIAMNPESFAGRTDKAILSTLVHEMTHLEQYHEGKPSPGGYHNKQWGDLMKRVGLYPSNTGLLMGKETGVQMTHYILEGEAFDKAADKLLATGWAIRWRTPTDLALSAAGGLSGFVPPSMPQLTGKRAVAKRASKTRYTCLVSGANAWGKPGLTLYTAEGAAVMLAMIEEG